MSYTGNHSINHSIDHSIDHSINHSIDHEKCIGFSIEKSEQHTPCQSHQHHQPCQQHQPCQLQQPCQQYIPFYQPQLSIYQNNRPINNPNFVTQVQLQNALRQTETVLAAQQILTVPNQVVDVAYIPWIPRTTLVTNMNLVFEAQVVPGSVFTVQVVNVTSNIVIVAQNITSSGFYSLPFTVSDMPSRTAVRIIQGNVASGSSIYGLGYHRS